jgi:hypothetical protein
MKSKAQLLFVSVLSFSVMGCAGYDTAVTETVKSEPVVLAAEVHAAQPEATDVSGFRTEVDEDGRLWILKDGQEKSEKHVTLVGAGPNGETIKALDQETVLEFLAAKPGFATMVEDGRVWVFREGQEMEPSEKSVTRVGAGPMGVTLKALDAETLDAYEAAGVE